MLDRSLDTAAADSLTMALTQALHQWKAHQQPIQGHTRVQDGRAVLVEALDDPSGCSADWLRRTVELTVLQATGAGLADAAAVVYRAADGSLASIPMQQVQHALATGQLTAETLVYDITVVHRDTFDGLVAPLRATWLNRYLGALQH